MRARIKAETGYDMDVVEKPLFSDTWPTLSLKRSSGDKGKGKGKARAGGPGRPAGQLAGQKWSGIIISGPR